MKKYIMVIDEGTTGTRALLFDKDFNIVSQSYEEFTQYTPSEDKVEHDAMEIYDKTIDMCKKAMAQAGAAPEEISGIGITNQRATTVIWDKETGVPLCKAIVWQDNLFQRVCERSPEQPACQHRRRTPFKRTGISAGTLRRQTPERGGHLDAAAVRGIQHPRPQYRQPESSRPESITRTDLRRQPRCHQRSLLRNTPGLRPICL